MPFISSALGVRLVSLGAGLLKLHQETHLKILTRTYPGAGPGPHLCR